MKPVRLTHPSVPIRPGSTFGYPYLRSPAEISRSPAFKDSCATRTFCAPRYAAAPLRPRREEGAILPACSFDALRFPGGFQQ
jgi:hypothetical protein